MAGTIPISMTQQFNAQGVPLVGGKLYLFQTGTTTPQNPFSDSGLTAALPNPITLDSSGRIPQFFLADGTIKVRLTDASGVIQAQWDNILVIGPSGGGGGGGGSTVDVTAIFQTGDVIWLDQKSPRFGWVRDNGRTIGSATSGATERANSDTQALFEFIWNTYPDSICPVVGGRGASATADFTASKQITLPDKRGYIPGGLDDMGNVAANRFVNVPVVSGNATTPGSTLGENAHQLSVSEIPSHQHDSFIDEQEHDHSFGAVNSVGGSLTPGNVVMAHQDITTSGGNTKKVTKVKTGVRVKSSASGAADDKTGLVGGGSSHNSVQRTVLGTFYRKL